MNFGPRKIVISIAAMPAIRTSPRSIAGRGDLVGQCGDERHSARPPRRRRAASVRRSSPTEREPLTSTESPGSRSAARRAGPRASASGAQPSGAYSWASSPTPISGSMPRLRASAPTSR